MIALLPLLVGAATFGLCIVFLQRRRVALARRRVSAFAAPRQAAVEPQEPESLTRVTGPRAAVEAQLRRLPLWARFETLVERADLGWRAPEVFYAACGGALLLLLATLALGFAPGAILLVLLVAAAAFRIWLSVRIERRRRAFEEQLPEFLASVASALRAGHALNQAIAAVVADSPQPIAKEFEQMLAEARLGRPVEDALVDLGARVRSSALDFVLDATLIQRQVGGSLASIFEVVAESVRQRQQFALRIRALTSMGRLSARVLLALPLVMAVGMSLLNPTYLAPLLGTPTGHKLIAVGLVLLGAGWLWLQRIVSAGGKAA